MLATLLPFYIHLRPQKHYIQHPVRHRLHTVHLQSAHPLRCQQPLPHVACYFPPSTSSSFHLPPPCAGRAALMAPQLSPPPCSMVAMVSRSTLTAPSVSSRPCAAAVMGPLVLAAASPLATPNLLLPCIQGSSPSTFPMATAISISYSGPISSHPSLPLKFGEHRKPHDDPSYFLSPLPCVLGPEQLPHLPITPLPSLLFTVPCFLPPFPH